MTPREELEARLTALLLGELPPEEATALGQAIAKDPDLIRLHNRLKQSIGLVRETVAAPEHESTAIVDVPKLGAERREKLLAAFKTTRRPAPPQSQRRKVNWREYAALAAMVVGLLGVAGILLKTRVEWHGLESVGGDAYSYLGREVRYGQRVSPIAGSGPPKGPERTPIRLAEKAPSERPSLGDAIVPPLLPATPEAKADQPLELAARRSPGIALPAFDDTPQSGSEGVSNGRWVTILDTQAADEKERIVGESQIAQRGFFESETSGGNLDGRDRRSAGLGFGGAAGLATGKDSGGPANVNKPAAAAPSPQSQEARFRDLNGKESFGNTEAKKGIAASGVEGMADLYSYGVAVPRSLVRVNPAVPPAPAQPPMVAAPKPASPDNIQLQSAIVSTNGIVNFSVAGNVANATPHGDWAGVLPQDGFALGGFKAPRPGDHGGLLPTQGRPAAEPVNSAISAATTDEPNAQGVFNANGVGYVNVETTKEKILAAKPDMNIDSPDLFGRLRSDGSITGDLKDRPVDAKKLADLSPIGLAGVSPESGTLPLDTEAAQSASETKRESGRTLAKKRALAAAAAAAEEPTFRKSRLEIALPEGDRGDALEKLQIATGPVTVNEVKESDPATALTVPKQSLAGAGSVQPLSREIKSLQSTRTQAQEFVDVLIPLKSANATEIAQAFASLSPNGSATTVGSQGNRGGLRLTPIAVGTASFASRLSQIVNHSGEDAALGQFKIIADQRNNSLLVFAGKKDLTIISNLLDKLNAPVPQGEVATAENRFSTFSLNVSDVSFKLAAASLEKGQMPEAATVRSEEFINAFDYRDPEPKGSAPIAFAWERARYPFAQDRDLVRFSVKTAASGRSSDRPLNLVLLLDNSGSMERADRVRIIQECLRVLVGQLQPQDRVSVVAFARTPRLWIDGLPGNQAGDLPQRVGTLTPQGGTNLEEAMNLAYQTALRHFLANGMNRVVLLTDGAANLGDVQPESLKKKVEAHRRQGIALDCFGIGWEGFNDELLETLSHNGDGRYGFINSPEAATSEFASQLAGALKVAASDVKVQVEFNPRRALVYRQIGYAKHQLTKEQFRDNTVDAAEIGAAEAGNALYLVQVNPAGEGPIGVVRVRFKIPGTSDYREHEWPVPYEGTARTLEQSSAALRLAASASAFSEWLVSSPYAGEVTPDKLLGYLNGVPEAWPADPRPKKLEWMIRQAKSVVGK